MLRLFVASAASVVALSLFAAVQAVEQPAPASRPKVQPASTEAELAIKGFELPNGFKCELAAAEPLFANPVCFSIDEQGRFYVAETFRLGAGVPDIRGRMSWLDAELASKSVEDRIAYTKRLEPNKLAWYTNDTDRISLVWDSDGDGKCDKASVFAEGFNGIADGIGSGVLARRGDVYYANIPHLWALRDTNDDGVADARRSLSYGYGVRFGFIGHDLHGLQIGPDGRLYFSIGDRGARVAMPRGRVVENLEAGAVYRCELDGSNLEIFHFGLRNPQELVFDHFGNFWTVDNNSDAGDPARVVYLAEGGDSGWRIGWQFIEQPFARGPWLAERLCYEYFRDRAAYALPPVSSEVGNGPSGLTYDPGIGLPDEWRGRFFLANFSGNPNSGIYSFAVQPKGAGFKLKDNKKFWWNFLPTDVDFGYDGCIYASDWVNGWSGPGKGRIYRIYHPDERAKSVVAGVKRLFAEGFTQRPIGELARLLEHADHRVRQEAQFALVEKKAIAILIAVAGKSQNLLARLHGIWGLGQLARQGYAADFAPLLADKEPEVRAQTVKVIGDVKMTQHRPALERALNDPAPRVRYFSAIALGRLGDITSLSAIVAMLRANGDEDPWLRHAGVMGLSGCAKEAELAGLAKDSSPAVRLAAVVALRKRSSPQLASFLGDADVRVVTEAARAINDLPVDAALPALAALAAQTDRFAALPAGTQTEPSPRDALLRRVLNANFRLGTPAAARNVVAWAGNEKLPEGIRLEALALLGDWAKPSGRDHITSLWRPLPERPAPDAKSAEPVALKLLSGGTSISAQAALLETAERLGWNSLGEPAFALASNSDARTKPRVAALKYLAAINSPRLAEAVALARKSGSEELRVAATQLASRVDPKNAVAILEAGLRATSLKEKQAAYAALAEIKTAEADRVLSRQLDDLSRGNLPSEVQLDLLEAAASRDNPGIKGELARFDSQRPDKDGLGLYLECLVGGDAEVGRKIFFEKVETQCIRCHKLNGEGGNAAPDLTGLGKRADRNYILESIILPNNKIAPGFENLIIALTNGTSYAGIAKKETADSLDLLSPEDGLVRIHKAEIQRRAQGMSGMPANMKDTLTRREVRDLVEFLAGLK